MKNKIFQTVLFLFFFTGLSAVLIYTRPFYHQIEIKRCEKIYRNFFSKFFPSFDNEPWKEKLIQQGVVVFLVHKRQVLTTPSEKLSSGNVLEAPPLKDDLIGFVVVFPREEKASSFCALNRFGKVTAVQSADGTISDQEIFRAAERAKKFWSENENTLLQLGL